MSSADDLGFTFRANKAGVVAIARGGRVVTLLRDVAARRFLAAVDRVTPAAAQQLMARATGNYRRGNERASAGQRRRS